MLKPPAVRVWVHLSILSATTLLLAFLILPYCVYASEPAKVFVDGMRIDTTPIMRDGTVYLPIQTMAQALRAEIVWDSKLNSVKIDGNVVPGTVYNYDGRIYLPAESFVSSLGGSVDFDGRSNRIIIKTNNAASSQLQTSTVSTNAPTARTTGSDPNGLSYRPVATATVQPVITPKASTTYTPAVPAANQSGVSSVQSSTGANSSVSLRPADASTYLPQNLRAGPVPQTASGLLQGGSASQPANAQRPQNGRVYVPKTAKNSVFQVTVTNVENISTFKDFYRPKEGHRYVIVYLSQQNISQQVQIYTGRFSLLDQKANSYDYMEGLSNFWLLILRPFGINFGYLVFEVPVDSTPVSLVLHSLNQAPLTVDI